MNSKMLRRAMPMLSLLVVACGGASTNQSARGGPPGPACANVAATSGDMPARPHRHESGPGAREGAGGMMGGGMMGGGMMGGGMMGGGMMGANREGSTSRGGMGPGARGGPNAGGGALAPLSDDTKPAIESALRSELAALDLYRTMSDQFKRPFRSLTFAEQRHVWALENLYAARGVEAPKVTPAAGATTFKDLKAACAAGVQAEKANIAMYDEALKKELPEDVRRVFTHLRAVSERHHLVAFQRCD